MSTDRTRDVSPPSPLVDVTLYDYGVGNLHSIKNALKRSGARVHVTQEPEVLLEAPAVVLPGVGAFGASMKTLLPVRDRLQKRLQDGTPCLAVCIGMQMLFEESEESPGIPGIGLFKGKVHALPATVGKVPHLGWNTLVPPQKTPPWQKETGAPDWDRLVPPTDSYAYFVHSYHAEPQEPITLATTHYGPHDHELEIAAIVARGNTFATQFHPEKSSAPGLRLIRAWVETAHARIDPERAKNAPHEQEGSP